MSENPSRPVKDRSDTTTNGLPVNRRRFLAGVGAGTAVASLAGCVGGGGGGGQEGPVRIGAIYLLSGLAQAFGQDSKRGAELGVGQINDAGGIDGREVEIFFRDHALSDAAEQIRSLAQEENVDALIGLTSSGVAIQTAPLYEQLDTPMMLTDIGTPFVTEHDEDTYGERAAGNDYVFRNDNNLALTVLAQHKAMDAMDQFTASESGSKWLTVAPDYAYGHQGWEYFKAYANAMDRGFELDDDNSVFPSLGTSDMTPQINKVVSAEPDGIFGTLWASDMVTFLQQSQQAGLWDVVDPHNYTGDLQCSLDVFRAMGDNMVDGLGMHGWYWHDVPDTEANRNFRDAYKSRYGFEPSMQSPSAYEAIFLYKKAIENAGSTTSTEIIAELEGLSHSGENAPRGEYTIHEESHQAIGLGTPFGYTAQADDGDLPYELNPVEIFTPTRDEVLDLLDGSGWPGGV